MIQGWPVVALLLAVPMWALVIPRRNAWPFVLATFGFGVAYWFLLPIISLRDAPCSGGSCDGLIVFVVFLGRMDLIEPAVWLLFATTVILKGIDLLKSYRS